MMEMIDGGRLCFMVTPEVGQLRGREEEAAVVNQWCSTGTQIKYLGKTN